MVSFERRCSTEKPQPPPTPAACAPAARALSRPNHGILLPLGEVPERSESDEPHILLPPGEVPERSEGDEPHILLPPGEVPERSEGDEGLMGFLVGFKTPSPASLTLGCPLPKGEECVCPAGRGGKDERQPQLTIRPGAGVPVVYRFLTGPSLSTSGEGSVRSMMVEAWPPLALPSRYTDTVSPNRSFASR